MFKQMNTQFNLLLNFGSCTFGFAEAEKIYQLPSPPANRQFYAIANNLMAILSFVCYDFLEIQARYRLAMMSEQVP